MRGIELGRDADAARYAFPNTATKNTIPFDAEIEYLESSGTQYINTGVVFSFNDDLSISGSIVNLSNNRSIIIGNYDANQVACLNIEFGGTSNNKARQFRCYTTKKGSPTVERWLNARPLNTLIDFSFTYTKQGDAVYVSDGVNSATFSLVSGQITPTSRALAMFLDYRPNNAVIAYGIRIYSLKIWKDGVLVRDYIAVRKDGVGYMYDRVSGQLFGNAGTGSFVLGPDLR
jgi:hypothetical protein